MSSLATYPVPPGYIIALFGNAQAMLSFAHPSSDGGAPILYFTIGSLPFVEFWNVDANESASRYDVVVPGLRNGESYVFVVSATNEIGQSDFSPISNAIVPGACFSFVFEVQVFRGAKLLFAFYTPLVLALWIQ